MRASHGLSSKFDFCGSRMTEGGKIAERHSEMKISSTTLERIVYFLPYSNSGSCYGFDTNILDSVKKRCRFARESIRKSKSL
jgi:hypothetical protein